VLQYFLAPLLLLRGSLLALLLANALYACAFAYYFYVTFLGYNTLPFLTGTAVFLYPVAAVLVGFVVAMATGWNCASHFLSFYFE
jgi:hypothetical protein